MPHTNVTEEVQKVYTKQNPSEAVFVQPGETIEGEALRCLQVAPQVAPQDAPKKVKRKANKSDAQKTTDA